MISKFGAAFVFVLFVAQASWGAVAYDAVSSGNASPGAGSTFSWTHTPSGTPRGVVCYVGTSFSGADELTGITYGGSAMSEVTGSPNFKATGEQMVMHAFFLGSSVPTGAQTVEVTITSTFQTWAYACFSVTASADTEIADSDGSISSDSDSNPSTTLSLGGSASFASIGFVSGIGDPSNTTPLTSWTSRFEYDFTPAVAGFYTYDTIGASDVTAGWTQGSADDAIAVAVAITESASSSVIPVLHHQLRNQ